MSHQHHCRVDAVILRHLVCASLLLLGGGYCDRVWAQPITQGSGYARCATGAYARTILISEVFGGAGNRRVITTGAGNKVRIFSWRLQSTVDTTLQFVEGTDATCSTGPSNVTGVFSPFTTVSRPFDNPTMSAPLVTNTTADDLCLGAGAAATISGWLSVCVEP